jgi:hypothetical protein
VIPGVDMFFAGEIGAMSNEKCNSNDKSEIQGSFTPFRMTTKKRGR